MKQKILNLLGLATRAGLLVSGEDIVIDAIQKKKANIMNLSSLELNQKKLVLNCLEFRITKLICCPAVKHMVVLLQYVIKFKYLL